MGYNESMEEHGRKGWPFLFVTLALIAIGVFVFLGVGDRRGNSPENEAKAQVFVYRDADVEEVEVRTGAPQQADVSVVARGVFPDSCTNIDSVMQDRAGAAFFVTLLAARPEGVLCAQVIVPFERAIVLEDTRSASSGDYTVDVNGISKAFRISSGY